MARLEFWNGGIGRRALDIQLQRQPFRLSELGCDSGFRFDRRDEPDTLVAEELMGFHFRLAVHPLRLFRRTER